MTRLNQVLRAVLLFMFAVQVAVFGQSDDARRILAEVRAALGGEERLANVKTLAVVGERTRVSPDGTSTASEFEWAIEWPNRFMKREEAANVSGRALFRRSGFNGNKVIDDIDAPPMMGGGAGVMRLGPGGPVAPGQATPEQIAAQQASVLDTQKRDFARLTLGLIAASSSVLPVEFAYAGQAASADGKAHVLDVKGPDGFSAKFFVDTVTHLPLMLSWTDKEPLRLTVGGGMQMTAGGGAPPDPAQIQRDMEERFKAAEAARRTVEYRIIYADYRAVDGVKLPARIQRMIDGLPYEELALERIRVNAKIDPSKFDGGKAQPGG
jgi:hypothetical protein